MLVHPKWQHDQNLLAVIRQMAMDTGAEAFLR